jgi:hypothetical protein
MDFKNTDRLNILKDVFINNNFIYRY